MLQAQLSTASKTAGGAEALHTERVAALQKACLPSKPARPPASETAHEAFFRHQLLCATGGQDAEKQHQQLGEAEERLQQLSASLMAAEGQAQALSKRVRALEAEAAEGARTAESHAARLAQQLTAKDAEAAELKKKLVAAEGETARLGEQVTSLSSGKPGQVIRLPPTSEVLDLQAAEAAEGKLQSLQAALKAAQAEKVCLQWVQEVSSLVPVRGAAKIIGAGHGCTGDC